MIYDIFDINININILNKLLKDDSIDSNDSNEFYK